MFKNEEKSKSVSSRSLAIAIFHGLLMTMTDASMYLGVLVVKLGVDNQVP